MVKGKIGMFVQQDRVSDNPEKQLHSAWAGLLSALPLARWCLDTHRRGLLHNDPFCQLQNESGHSAGSVFCRPIDTLFAEPKRATYYLRAQTNRNLSFSWEQNDPRRVANKRTQPWGKLISSYTLFAMCLLTHSSKMILKTFKEGTFPLLLLLFGKSVWIVSRNSSNIAEADSIIPRKGILWVNGHRSG